LDTSRGKFQIVNIHIQLQNLSMKVIFNPRCTKCRILSKELDAHEVAWERVLYLEGALDRALVE